jgi:hypothetical protein
MLLGECKDIVRDFWRYLTLHLLLIERPDTSLQVSCVFSCLFFFCLVLVSHRSLSVLKLAAARMATKYKSQIQRRDYNDSSDDEEDEAIELLFSTGPIFARKSVSADAAGSNAAGSPTTANKFPEGEALHVTQESEEEKAACHVTLKKKLELEHRGTSLHGFVLIGSVPTMCAAQGGIRREMVSVLFVSFVRLSCRHIKLPAQQEAEKLAVTNAAWTNDIADLAWHMEPKSGKVYPCRRNCPHYEAKGLTVDERFRKVNFELVQYLGIWSKRAGQYASAAKSQLLPILKEDDASYLKEHVASFVKETKRSQPDLKEMNLLVEGALVPAIIVHVQHKQHQKRLEQSQQHQAVARQEEQACGEEPSKSASTLSIKEQTEFKIAGIASEVGKRTSEDRQGSNDSAGSSDDESIGNYSIGSTDAKGRKSMGAKEPLRNGDIIQYDPPNAVAGIKDNLQTARIVGVKPRNDQGGFNTFPLILANGDLLPRDTLVMRVQYRWRGDLKDNTDKARFKRIDRYALSKCGESSLQALLQARGEKMAELLSKDVPDEMKDFFHSFAPNTKKKSGSNDGSDRKPEALPSEGAEDINEESTSTLDVQQKTTIHSKARKSLGSLFSKTNRDKVTAEESKKRRRTQPVVPSSYLSSRVEKSRSKAEAAWKQHLSGLIEKVKTRSSRRSQPHLSVKQLSLALSVWEILEDQIETRRMTSGVSDRKAPICKLADDIEVSFSALDRFLHGDEDKVVRIADVQKIETSLTTWLELQPANQASSSSLSLENVSVSENLDLAPTVFSSKPVNASEHSRLGESLSSLTALHEEASPKENMTEAISQTPQKKRRLNATGDDEGVNGAQGKRRSSLASMKRRASSQSTVDIARAAAVASEAFQLSRSSLSIAPPSPGTARKRRKSVAVYEPPSVTKARKRRVDGTNENESMGPISAKKRRSSVTGALSAASDAPASTAATPRTKEKTKQLFDWKVRLPELIKVENQNMATKGKRYVSRIAPGQLQRAMEVWQQLEEVQHNSDQSLDKIIVDVASELDNVTPNRLVFFLTGDEKKSLSPQAVDRIDVALRKWLVDRQSGRRTLCRQKQPRETIDAHTLEEAKAGNEDIAEDTTLQPELELESK